MPKTKNKIGMMLFYTAIIAMSLFLIINNSSCETSYIVLIWSVIINLIGAIKYRDNWSIFIIFCFIGWCNYSFYACNALNAGDQYFAGWSNNTSVMVPASNCVLLFSTLLSTITVKNKKNKEKKQIKSTKGIPNFLFTIMIILLFAILLFTFTRPDQAGIRGASSSIYEYSTALFVVLFYFTNNKTQKKILIILSLLFILQDLLYGGRVTALQIILVLFIYFISEKITIKKALPFILIGIVIFTGIGDKRASYNLETSQIENSINNIIDRKGSLDTAYSAFYTSGTFIKTRQAVSDEDRHYLTNQYILSLIMGGGVKDSNLARYTNNYYPHFGGSVLPIFIYFHFGYLGVILIGVILVFTLNKLFFSKKTNSIIYNASIYFIASLPRWYLYSISTLIRGIVIIIAICLIFNAINKRRFKNSCAENSNEQ